MLKLEQLSLRSSLSEIEGGGACTAIRSLTLSSKERATILLYNILKKGDSNVLLWESCILAWRLKLPHIEELLNSIVSRSRGWGRQYSIFVLGEIGAHNSLPQIIEALSDTSPAVRRHSVLAISKVGDGSALAELRRLRDSDSDEIVRSLAAKTILEIENGLSSLEDVYPGL
jgi:HEAT repeat protein